MVPGLLLLVPSFLFEMRVDIGWHFRLERSRTRRQPLFDLLDQEFFGLRHDAIIFLDDDDTDAILGIPVPPPGFGK